MQADHELQARAEVRVEFVQALVRRVKRLLKLKGAVVYQTLS